MNDEFASGMMAYGKIILAQRPSTLLPLRHYETHILEIIRRNKLTIRHSHFEPFEEGGDLVGFTAAVVLAESHVTLHTWFERGYIDVDVFTCNAKNDKACEQTFDDIATFFKAKKVIKKLEPR